MLHPIYKAQVFRQVPSGHPVPPSQVVFPHASPSTRHLPSGHLLVMTVTTLPSG